VLFYQRTILNAFRETNDALVGSQKKLQEADAQAARVNALRDYARLSRLKFDNGAASYLEVLYAENELFAAELAAVRSRGERYTELVNVYKAMGGGWVDLADQTTPKPLNWKRDDAALAPQR
jgi:multidrug efflux system outer membrane protein